MSFVRRHSTPLPDSLAVTYRHNRRKRQGSSSWATRTKHLPTIQIVLSQSPREESLLKQNIKDRNSASFEGFPPNEDVKQELGLPPLLFSRETSGANSHGASQNRHELETKLYHSRDSCPKERTERGHPMRKVRNDDYLLARGANPRTGVLTPGYRSVESSVDERDISTARGLDTSSKWRQKGDEWISLGVGEPTPLPSPPPPHEYPHGGRTLRTPPKLKAGTRSHNRVAVRDLDDKFVVDMPSARDPRPRSMSDKQIRDFQKALRLAKRSGNGTIDARLFLNSVASPSEASAPKIKTTSKCNDSAIRRKPVGSPPGKLFEVVDSNKQDLPNVINFSVDTVITDPNIWDQGRVSSAPTPRKFWHLGPDGVVNDLRAAPGEGQSANVKKKSALGRTADQHFLAVRRGDWIEDTPFLRVESRQDMSNRLPGPPTGNIQSQPQVWKMQMESSRSNPIFTDTRENRIRRPSGYHGADAAYSYVRREEPPIPPRHNHLVRDLHQERQTGNTSNPNLLQRRAHFNQSLQPHRQRGRVSGPAAMNSRSCLEQQQQQLESDIYTALPTTISTNIDIPVPTSTNVNHGTPQDLSYITSGNEKIPERGMLTDSGGPTRPQMPGRGDGTGNIPRVSIQKDASKHHCWELSYMSLGANSTKNGTDTELTLHSLERKHASVTTEPHKSDNTLNVVNSVGDGQHEAGRRSREPSLTKNSPRYQDTFFEDKLHSMPGSISMQETLAEALVCAKGSLKGVYGSSEHGKGNIRDHSGCCPECCAEDCHDGCLSHPQTSSKHPAAPIVAESWIEDKAGLAGFAKELLRKSTYLGKSFQGRDDASEKISAQSDGNSDVETRTEPLRGGSGTMLPNNSWGDVSLGTVTAARRALRVEHGSNRLNFSKVGNRVGSSNLCVERNATGPSAANTKMTEVPGLGTANEIFEGILVPVGGLKMWIKQHPQMIDLGRQLLCRGVEMVLCVLDTAGKVYRVSYIYSKTGRIEAARAGGVSKLLGDCARSVVYVIIVGAAFVLMVRLLGVLVGVAAWVLWGFRGVLLVVKRLGLGFGW